jgi:hypothetical protein
VLVFTEDRDQISKVVDLIGRSETGNLEEEGDREEIDNEKEKEDEDEEEDEEDEEFQYISSVQIGYLSFNLDQKKSYELGFAARKLAVEDAIVKAQQLVDVSNLRFEEGDGGEALKKFNFQLGEVIEIRSQDSQRRPEQEEYESHIACKRFRRALSDEDLSIPFAPGKATISSRVEIRFKIIQDSQ